MSIKDKLIDKLYSLFDKFYYTKIAIPEDYDDELISMGCFDDISITGYNDYLIIHLNNYDWKISYDQAEVLIHDLDYVLAWRKA